MDGAHSVATSSATRALNQQDNLGFACCAALKAKSPGMKGTSRNLPVTLFSAYLCCSQQQHRIAYIGSTLTRSS